MEHDGAIDTRADPQLVVPPRRTRGRLPERIAAGITAVLVVLIVAVVLTSDGESLGEVETDQSPHELLWSAADHLDLAGTVLLDGEGELELTPEAGSLSLDQLAVRATVTVAGDLDLGHASWLAVDFQLTDGPLPPELGPSHLEHVVVGDDTWTRLDDEDWEESDVPEGVIDLPRLDEPDELLRLALERGQDLRVAETTTVDGVEAHRVDLTLTPADVGVELTDTTARPVQVDVYVAADDGRLLRLDMVIDGQAADPVPAHLTLRLRTFYDDHGRPVEITPP